MDEGELRNSRRAIAYSRCPKCISCTRAVRGLGRYNRGLKEIRPDSR